MSTSFFKTASSRIGPSNLNMEARAIGSPVYKGRGDASGAAKGFATALTAGKSKFKAQKSNGAYPPGPKI